jgi:hypothetical protein
MAAEAKRAPRLSLGQVKTLERLRPGQCEESPYGYGRRSAGMASAWHRTVEVLHRLGLVEHKRYGDHYAATITADGVRWLEGKL